MRAALTQAPLATALSLEGLAATKHTSLYIPLATHVFSSPYCMQSSAAGATAHTHASCLPSRLWMCMLQSWQRVPRGTAKQIVTH